MVCGSNTGLHGRFRSIIHFYPLIQVKAFDPFLYHPGRWYEIGYRRFERHTWHRDQYPTRSRNALKCLLSQNESKLYPDRTILPWVIQLLFHKYSRDHS